jgi:HK97 gp10 family phage protein
MSNKFTLKSFAKEVQRDIEKAEQEKLKKASNLFKSRLRAKIRSMDLIYKGSLLKGVSSSNLEHASLVGMSAPAFHALIVEYGTEERNTLGQGEERKGIRGTGKMPAQPFFLPTMQESTGDIQQILSEEWL